MKRMILLTACILLLTGCADPNTGSNAELPPAETMPAETEPETEPVTTTTTADPMAALPDIDSLTEDDILTLSDEEVIALALCSETEQLPQPQYLAFLPNGVEQVSDTSATTQLLAQQLAEMRLGDFAEMHFESEEPGFWWYYRSDPDSDGCCYDYLVPNAAFVDLKSRLLKAGVNEDNMLRLAAMRAAGHALPFATFVRDEGAMFACTQYSAHYDQGGSGANDTAVLAMHTFWARKDTGFLLNFWDDPDKTMRKVEVPGTAETKTETVDQET